MLTRRWFPHQPPIGRAGQIISLVSLGIPAIALFTVGVLAFAGVLDCDAGSESCDGEPWQFLALGVNGLVGTVVVDRRWRRRRARRAALRAAGTPWPAVLVESRKRRTGSDGVASGVMYEQTWELHRPDGTRRAFRVFTRLERSLGSALEAVEEHPGGLVTLCVPLGVEERRGPRFGADLRDSGIRARRLLAEWAAEDDGP